jgi:hypothetical protein
MANFSNSLNEEDVEAIHQFLIKRQRELFKAENSLHSPDSLSLVVK